MYAFIILYKIWIRIFQSNLADMSLMQPDGNYFHLSQNIYWCCPYRSNFYSAFFGIIDENRIKLTGCIDRD